MNTGAYHLTKIRMKINGNLNWGDSFRKLRATFWGGLFQNFPYHLNDSEYSRPQRPQFFCSAPRIETSGWYRNICSNAVNILFVTVGNGLLSIDLKLSETIIYRLGLPAHLDCSSFFHPLPSQTSH